MAAERRAVTLSAPTDEQHPSQRKAAKPGPEDTCGSRLALKSLSLADCAPSNPLRQAASLTRPQGGEAPGRWSTDASQLLA